MSRQLALSAINYFYKKFHLLNTPLTLATNNIYITAYKTYLHYFKKVCPLDQHDHIMSGFKSLYTSSGSSNSLSNIILENSDNDPSNEANADTSCLPKARGTKQSKTVGVISELES